MEVLWHLEPHGGPHAFLFDTFLSRMPLGKPIIWVTDLPTNSNLVNEEVGMLGVWNMDTAMLHPFISNRNG